jgi:uncharacterized protein YxjI
MAEKTNETISFKTSREDARLIGEIAQRAVKLAESARIEYHELDAHMDITACHVNGCRLRLRKLLTADDANFGHDVFGIRRHINRTTGRLEDCFLPRFAARDAET